MFGRYEERKVIEVLLYVANKKSVIDRHGLSKILYFADKAHLEYFGRTITGDNYVKMDFGPVPSKIYDYIKQIDTENALFTTKGYTLIPKREANIEELSESDIDVLDSIIAKYGSKSFRDKTELSHDKTWKKSDLNKPIPADKFLLGLKNKDEIIEMHELD